MEDDRYKWLDPIVEQQAAYYGLTVEKFIRGMFELCEAQELVENEGEPYAPPAATAE